MIEGFVGVTVIETSVGAVTVNSVESKIVPDVALIVEEPVPTPLASPAVLIVATVLVAELQVTLPVRFCVLLSL